MPIGRTAFGYVGARSQVKIRDSESSLQKSSRIVTAFPIGGASSLPRTEGLRRLVAYLIVAAP